MSMSVNKQIVAEYAKANPWREILEPVGFSSTKMDQLRDGEPVLIWIYDDGELQAFLQTCGEDEPAVILDPNHSGSQRLSKFDAIKIFKCGDDWTIAKAFILESSDLEGNAINQIGRKMWWEYQQTSKDMSPAVRYIADPLFQSQVDTEFASLATRDLAKSKFEEMKFAQEGSPVKPIALTEFIAREIPANKWVVEGLLIKSGKAFFAAKAKAGKTTMCLALLKSLADGVSFLGKFDVTAPSGRIGYMNLELTENQMQEWVIRQNIANPDRVHFWNLRGKANPFRTPTSQQHLIDEMKELGIRTLFIDTFAKVFPGEANNNSEVSRFLVMLDEVLDRAGVEQLIMLVHAGNDAKKIRGATALTDHPDGIWYLYTDDQNNRFFSAIGRDVDIPEGQILYDESGRTLTYSGAGKKVAKEQNARSIVLAFIQENPGANASTVDDCIEGTKSYKSKIRKQLLGEKHVSVRKGPNNSTLYYAI